MSVKYFCLKCERTSNCLCHTDDYRYLISYKLRVPPTKNKVKFRQFLDDCPMFVNMVRDEQQPLFLDLLRKVKHFDKTINGRKWTNISK